MAQNIILFIIMAVCVLYVGKSIYNTISGKKTSPCNGCNGCAFKEKLNQCRKKQP